MKRLSSLAAALSFLAASTACGREAGPTPKATAATQPGPPPAATGASQAPSPAEAAAAAEIRKEIAGFSLTEPTLEKIIAIEGELKDFWADPVEARKIRGERSLPKILAAIDASPRLKATIAKHGLTPREYILGTFSMIAAYVWEKARAQQPASVEGKTPPANAATLATVQKRLADITKLLSPHPRPTKPHTGKEED